MIRYGARALPWPLLAAGCATVAGLMWLVGRWVWAWPLEGAGVGLVAGIVAWSMDERCADIVDTLPRGLAWRTTVRAAVIPVVCALWVGCVVAIRDSLPTDHLGLYGMQGVAAAFAALSYTLWRRARGVAEPGQAFATVVVPATTATALAGPLLAVVPLFPLLPEDDWAMSRVIWGAVTAAAVMGVVLTWRAGAQRRKRTIVLS